eukprot:m51a1_g1094 hypothetical protein (935) ;mRNA; f:69710-73146
MMRGRGRGSSKDRSKDRSRPPRACSDTLSSMASGRPDPAAPAPAVTRLTYALLTLVGRHVEVHTRSGDVIEGVLHAAEPQPGGAGLGVALRMARSRSDAPGSLPVPALIVGAGDFDRLVATGVDPHEHAQRHGGAVAAHAGFATDAQISESRGAVGQAGEQRELERWDGAETASDMDLEIDWKAGKGNWDQFATNERLFNVRSTYNEELYTTKIDYSNPRYEQQRRRAEALAREIEGETSHNPHLAEERGHALDDGSTEEDRYGAVIRPAQQQQQQQQQPLKKGASKTPPELSPRSASVGAAYVPPHRRGSSSKPVSPDASIKGKDEASSEATSPADTTPTASPPLAQQQQQQPQAPPFVSGPATSPQPKPAPEGLGPLSPRAYHRPAVAVAPGQTKKPRSLSSSQPLPMAPPAKVEQVVRQATEQQQQSGESPSPRRLLAKLSKSIAEETRPRSHSEAVLFVPTPPGECVSAPLSPQLGGSRTGRSSPVIVECSASGPGTKNPLLMERLRVRQMMVQNRHKSSLLSEAVPLVPDPKKIPGEMSPNRALAGSPLIDNHKSLQALQLDPSAPEVPPEVLRDFRAFQVMKANDPKARQRTLDDLRDFSKTFTISKSPLSMEVTPDKVAATAPATPVTSARPSPAPSPAHPLLPEMPSKAPSAGPQSPSSTSSPQTTPRQSASSAAPTEFTMKLNYNAAAFTPKVHVPSVVLTQPPLFAPSLDKRPILDAYYEAVAHRLNSDPPADHFPVRWPGRGSWKTEGDNEMQPVGILPTQVVHSPSYVPLPPPGMSTSPHGMRPAGFPVVPPPPMQLLGRFPMGPQPGFPPPFYAPVFTPGGPRYPSKPPSPALPGSAVVTAAAHAVSNAGAPSSPQAIPLQRPLMDYSPTGGLVAYPYPGAVMMPYTMVRMPGPHPHGHHSPPQQQQQQQQQQQHDQFESQ